MKFPNTEQENMRRTFGFNFDSLPPNKLKQNYQNSSFITFFFLLFSDRSALETGAVPGFSGNDLDTEVKPMSSDETNCEMAFVILARLDLETNCGVSSQARRKKRAENDGYVSQDVVMNVTQSEEL